MDDKCDGYPMVELDSDVDDFLSSSEDEIEVILRGTPKQKRALRRKSLGQKSSSEDEFEKELDAELNQRINCIAAAQNGIILSTGDDGGPPENSESEPKTKQSQKKKSGTKELSDSCSEEDEKAEGKKGSTRPPPSHEELLYGPDLDDLDQQWVDRQRRSYQVRTDGADGGSDASGGRRKKAPSTDAVLCCPACMVVLCRDCQRHSLYKNQFRAMFVTNCSVDRSELLKYPTQPNHCKKAKKSKLSQSLPQSNEGNGETSSKELTQNSIQNTSDNEKYHAVNCTSCTTHVAMFDTDEVYHFFNVLEGNG